MPGRRNCARLPLLARPTACLSPNLWGILPNHQQAYTEVSHARSTCADSASREHLPRPPNTPPPTCNTRCVLTSWSPGTIDGANRNYVERTYWRAKSPNVKFNRSRVFAKRVRQELVAASHLLRGGYKWRCRGARSTTGGTTRTADGSCMATEGWAASAGGQARVSGSRPPCPSRCSTARTALEKLHALGVKMIG